MPYMPACTPVVEIPMVEPLLAACQPVVVPYSRSPLPAMFGIATQVAALQKAPLAQSASLLQVVPQVIVGVVKHWNPLQLCDTFGMQELALPSPSQTLFETTEPVALSHESVMSQT